MVTRKTTLPRARRLRETNPATTIEEAREEMITEQLQHNLRNDNLEFGFKPANDTKFAGFCEQSIK